MVLFFIVLFFDFVPELFSSRGPYTSGKSSSHGCDRHTHGSSS